MPESSRNFEIGKKYFFIIVYIRRHKSAGNDIDCTVAVIFLKYPKTHK